MAARRDDRRHWRTAVIWLAGKTLADVVAARLAIAVRCSPLSVAVLAERGRFDTLSFCFALLIAVVGALNMTHATAYLAGNHAQPRFYAAFAVMIAGLIGLCAASDIFSFFAFWELMSSWALWAAIVHEETVTARREGFKYFFFNTVGAGFMFLGVAVIATAAGTTDLAAIGRATPTMPLALLAGGLLPIFLGLVMKAAMLPVRIDVQMQPGPRPHPGLRLHLGRPAEERPPGAC